MATSTNQTINVRIGAARVMGLLKRIPHLIRGRTGAGGTVQQLQVRLGLAALRRIHRSFLVKSLGGADETGLRWKPLSPKTVAYNRIKEIPPKRRRAAFAPSYALKDKERDRWWHLYRRSLATYKGDKSHAAAVAWFVLKKEGALTLLMLYGDRRVPILRDTEELYASLAPGADADTALSQPPRVKSQVFRLGKGEVTIGTKRKWAWTHHRGLPERGLPQRRLWPQVSNWSPSWWRELLKQSQRGVMEMVLFLLR